MNRTLPRYKISIDQALSKDGEKLGMTQIAMVSNPAILTKGVFLSSITNKMLFSDELKLRVAAPALIPDLPIYRNDDELGEYEVVFDRETIEAIRQDFMENKGNAAFNLDHTEVEAPSFILDSWITGPSETDPSFTKYGIEVPEGSWFIVSQFKDKEYFQNEIINKERYAYSIEGFLGLSLSQIKKTEQMNELLLPDGEHQIGEKIYIIKDGKVVEVKDVVKEDAPVAEAPAEMAEAPVVPEVAPVAPAVEEPVIDTVSYSKEEIDTKFAELYKAIAEIKTLVEADAAEDVAEVEKPAEVGMQKMSAQETLSAFINGMK